MFANALPKAIIFSIEGASLSENERALFREANPFGFILFSRNCISPDQIRALVDELKEVTGRTDVPILIDQEGGRVQRLRAPQWTNYPPMQNFGNQAIAEGLGAAQDALTTTLRQQSEELLSVGVNANCAPVLDVLFPQTHDVIGDRAFSDNPQIVGELGLTAARALRDSGVQPIIKHIPGHGRGEVDSHHDLPVVSASRAELTAHDFAPFAHVARSDIGGRVWAMMAHIIYDAIDAENVATCSPAVISEIVRGEIGFDGLLMGDDVDMQALARYGDIARRALLSLEAGCDLVLHCSGKFADMAKLSEVVGELSAKAHERLILAA